MRHLRITIVIVLCCAVPRLCLSVDLSDLIGGNFDTASKTVRKEIAEKLLKEIGELSEYISDEKWILNERKREKDISGEAAARHLNLIESYDFQSQILFNHLNSIKENLEIILTPDIKISVEMCCWAIVSHGLTDQEKIDGLIQVLQSVEKIPENIDEHIDINAEEFLEDGAFYKWYGRGILEYIVIPYLYREMGS